jgi:competence protein ComEC
VGEGANRVTTLCGAAGADVTGAFGADVVMNWGPDSGTRTNRPSVAAAGTLLSRLVWRESLFGRWTHRHLADLIEEIQHHEIERLALWLPVGFAFGAALACGLRADDPAWVWAGLTVFGLLIWLVATARVYNLKTSVRASWIGAGLGFAGLLLAAFAGGGAAGLFRADAVSAPIVTDLKGARLVSGFVERVDRSQSGNWRALLAVRSISGLSQPDTPIYVRISLKEAEPPLPGQALTCQAILRPPPGPVVPGAYDFSRRAWFARLGGVGFATEPCQSATNLGTPPWKMAVALHLSQARAQAARAIVEASPGGGGGFLAAITTGDRSWLDPADIEALQVSGLSHIISVSGLHVGILGGLVFLVIWKVFALVPALALRIDPRKIGACAAIGATGAYTLFTGAEAPAVRAFVMAGIAFGAILLNRQAISMRGLAFAAVLVLMVRPESALEPGFQMSFLATAALVAMWEVWQTRVPGEAARGPIRTALIWLAAAAATSLVAGLATAPVSAWAFQRVSPWALPANVLSAPIMDFWVAPTALLAAAFSPFGAGDWLWALSGRGLDLTLKIARFVAGLPGAGTHVKWTDAPGPVVLICAILWLTLWRSRLRYLSALLLMVGVGLWLAAPRPVGWIGPEGRAVLATPARMDPSLCRTTGARFDSVRLTDAAGLSTSSAERVLPPSQIGFRRGCWTGEGDWEARFVEQGRGRAVLALTLDGKSYAFGKDDLPEGALILRAGWQVDLYQPPPAQGPWARRRSDARRSDPDDADIATRLDAEQ